jgi:hypothetical protein
MVWRAAARVASPGTWHWSEWAGLVGAVLFAFSDSLIAMDRFYAELPGIRFAIITTYWLALTLIAFTVSHPERQSTAT